MDNSSNTTAGGMKCCQSLSVQLNPDQLCCRCKAMRAGLCLAVGAAGRGEGSAGSLFPCCSALGIAAEARTCVGTQASFRHGSSRAKGEYKFKILSQLGASWLNVTVYIFSSIWVIWASYFPKAATTPAYYLPKNAACLHLTETFAFIYLNFCMQNIVLPCDIYLILKL